VARTAEEHLAQLEKAPDFVELDRLRTGLGKAVVGRLTELRPRRIAIVACDPATLARDLAGQVPVAWHMERDSCTLTLCV
jgi:23S rRNA (uracil1939-C5)-methyltransferase